MKLLEIDVMGPGEYMAGFMVSECDLRPVPSSPPAERVVRITTDDQQMFVSMDVLTAIAAWVEDLKTTAAFQEQPVTE